ncbi:MAG: exodeoxyribonuclease III [Proteobacteria bacterium]|nr:exodeoxyribonuclease III [Pseudomonadota bacterium]
MATWNVNSIRQRLDHLVKWAKEASPDVICLQETKVTNDKFPAAAIAAAGYPHQLIDGQKSYNGVAILSRLPLMAPQKGFSVDPDPQKRFIAATVDGIRLFCCYVPVGTAVGSEKFTYKLDWFDRILNELNGSCQPDDKVVVCGDLNVAPDDASVWDPFALEGHLLFHPAEREALEKLIDWGLVDAYRQKNPFGGAFSWWDYRGGAFNRNLGLRIDHHLISKPLAEVCQKVTIWREVRGWNQPSDHVPVVVDFGL